MTTALASLLVLAAGALGDPFRGVRLGAPGLHVPRRKASHLNISVTFGERRTPVVVDDRVVVAAPAPRSVLLRSFYAAGRRKTVQGWCPRGYRLTGGGCSQPSVDARVSGAPGNGRRGSWQCQMGPRPAGTNIGPQRRALTPRLSALCAGDAVGIHPRVVAGKSAEAACPPKAPRVISFGCFGKSKGATVSRVELGAVACTGDGAKARLVCAAESSANYTLLPPSRASGHGEATARCPSPPPRASGDPFRVLVVGGGCMGAHRESVPLPDLGGWTCIAPSGSREKVTAYAMCASVRTPRSQHGDSPQRILSIPSKQDEASFAVTSKHVSLGGVTMQRPLVLSFGGSGVFSAHLTGWSSDRRVPPPSTGSSVDGNNARPLTFRVRFICRGNGTGTARVMLRFLLGKTQRQRLGFHVKKTCDRSAARAEPAVPAVSIGTSDNTADVIEKGRVALPYQLLSESPKSFSDEAVAYSFYLSASARLHVLGAQANTDDPSIATARVLVMGGERSGRTVLVAPGEARAVITLAFFCVGRGVTRVSVSVRTDRGLARFHVRKTCAGEYEPQGWPVMGLTVSAASSDEAAASSSDTSSQSSVVAVTDGLVTPQFQTHASGQNRFRYNVIHDEVAPGTVWLVPGGVQSQTFSVSLKHELFAIDFEAPFVSSEPLFPGRKVAIPSIGGAIALATRLQGNRALSMRVSFHCIRVGHAAVTVVLPVVVGALGAGRQSANIPIRFYKKCDGRDMDGAEGIERGLSGLDVGHRAPDDVIENGVVQPNFGWSDPSTDGEDQDGDETPGSKPALFRFRPAERVVKFLLRVNPEADNKTAFDITRVVAIPHVDIARPVAVLQPAVARVDKAHRAVLELEFNCIHSGRSAVTVTMHARTDGSDKLSSAQFHLEKQCVDPLDAPVDERGGVKVLGLNIVTESAGRSVVVRNGFPTIPYFGQRNKLTPDWDNVTVAQATSTSTFALLFDPRPPYPSRSACLDEYTGECSGVPYFCGDDDGCACVRRCDEWFSAGEIAIAGKQVEFDAPAMFLHDRVSRPMLLGPASRGGRLSAARTSDEFSIEWNCVHSGLSVVTVQIPIVGLGFVTFTVPKRCGGGDPPHEGVQLTGLMVSTWSDPAQPPDVVLNGITQPQYTVSRQDNLKIVAADQTQASFFTWRHDPKLNVAYMQASRGAGAVDGDLLATGVYVIAQRPICNPTVSHDLEPFQMHNNLSRGELSPSELPIADALVVDTRAHTINVTFNCVWDGETKVSVLIPLVGGGRVSFSFVKLCETEAMSLAPVLHCAEWSTDVDGSELGEALALGGGLGLGAMLGSRAQARALHKCAECDPGYNLVSSGVHNVSDRCQSNTTDSGTGGYEDDDGEGGSEDGSGGDFSRWDEQGSQGGWDSWGDDDYDDDFYGGQSSNTSQDAGKSQSTKRTPLGYINIATTRDCASNAERCDVARGGFVSDYYSVVSSGSGPLQGLHRIVSEDERESLFYLSVPTGLQLYKHASVMARSVNSNKDVCEPLLTGAGARGGALSGGDRNSPVLRVRYNCRKAGVARVLLTVPLDPQSLYGTQSFSLTKICGGFETRVDEAITAPGLLEASLVVVFLVVIAGAFIWYRRNKSFVERYIYGYAPVSTVDDRDRHDIKMVRLSGRGKPRNRS